MTFQATSEQDLNPRSCVVNDHPSPLSHETMTIAPGEKTTTMLTWKPTVISSLVLTMIAFPYQYIVTTLGWSQSLLLRSVGHRVKTHKLLLLVMYGVTSRSWIMSSRGRGFGGSEGERESGSWARAAPEQAPKESHHHQPPHYLTN